MNGHVSGVSTALALSSHLTLMPTRQQERRVVMVFLGDFEANILCDGQPLPEYQIEKLSDGRVKCWVPSQTGKAGIQTFKLAILALM